jgi:hypothetical protein
MIFMLFRLFVLFIIFASVILLADVVELSDGGRLVGKIIERTDDEVTVLTIRGIVARVPMERVSKIEEGSPQELYKKQMEEIDKKDADEIYDFAVWCRDVGLVNEAKELFRRVITLKPDHQEARWALGYLFRDGKWISEDEWRVEQGYVKYNDEWVKKEDLEKIKAGYVRYEGEWVSKEDYENLKKGLRKYGDKWMTEEEYYKAQGYVQYKGRWVSKEWLEKQKQKSEEEQKKAKPKFSKGQGGRTGVYTQKIEIEGKEREFVVNAPQWVASGQASPLVVLLHGTNSRPQYMLYHFDPVIKGTAIIAAPWALGGKWLEGAPESKNDDKFILEMVEWIKKHYNIALDRIYLAGHSRGGFYTFRLGVRYGDIFAACGILSGGSSGYIDPSERKAPFYIYIVERDPSVSVESARQARDELKKNGHEVKYHEVSGGTGTAQDHELNRLCCQECWEFMTKQSIK